MCFCFVTLLRCIDTLDDQEEHKGNDNEIQRSGEEHTIFHCSQEGKFIEMRQVGCLKSGFQDQGGDDIFDQGTDDFVESGTDDNTDGQVDNITPHGEGFEFFEHRLGG